MKRVLVGALHHESNSFNPIVAGENDFRVLRGKELIENIRKNDSLSGVIQTLLDKGYEVIPTVSCRAVPNGEVDLDFFMGIKNELLEVARKENEIKPIDAVCLSLHGSMRIKGLGEAEGVLLEELKEILPNIPFYSSLDMHTTMTKKMFDNCDGFVGYKCAPHTDCTETGEHAARMTIAALEEGVKTNKAWVRVPFLVAGEQSSTNTQPMIDLISELRETEKQDGIYATSYLMGFPWADNEDSSVAVFVVANCKEKAEETAIRLADTMWKRLDDFTFHTETYEEKEAIDIAFNAVKEGPTPVYLSDSGDNPTAGSSSDCTDFLRLLMDDNRTNDLKNNIIYGGIYDPEATKLCKGKVGEEITITFGAKFDTVTTNPITATGIVKSYIEKWPKDMLKGDLALFSSNGVDIVLAEKHVGFTTPEMYEDLGRNPKDADIVVCKLGYLTAPHEEVSKRSIMALSKGSTNEDLKTLPYKKVPRPLFPLDKGFSFNPKDNLISK